MDRIEDEWKILRDDLFEVRLAQKMSKDKKTLNNLRDRETEILKRLKEVAVAKADNEERYGKKK
ncbi:MAG: hypothetical protein VZS44_04320 [Bacilli bacterium]|nr:hypothetical protein [Bacilli bacterium]